MRFFALSLLVFSMFLTLGCGDDDEFARADGPVSEGDAAETSAEAICNAYRACDCGDIVGVSLVGCETGLEFSWQAREDRARELGLTYDGDCLAKRINAMADRGCALPDTNAIPFCSGETCLIWHGTRAEGEECEGGGSLSDCQQGLVCLGTCQKPCANTGFDIAEGEVCRDVEAEFFGNCADGLVCDADDGICKALPTVGEPCPLNVRCAEGLVCDTSSGSPICAEPLAVGESCILPLQCESRTCTEGSCAPPPGDGETCIQTCAEGFVCGFDASSGMGTCQPPGAEGEECVASIESGCADGLSCVYPNGVTEPGVCIASRSIGESCQGPGGGAIACVEGAICGIQSCQTTPNAPGCDQCPDGDDTCTVRVCTEIPPQVCNDSGGLLF